MTKTMSNRVKKRSYPVMKRSLIILDQRTSMNRYKIITETQAKKFKPEFIITLKMWEVFKEPRNSPLFQFLNNNKQLEFPSEL